MSLSNDNLFGLKNQWSFGHKISDNMLKIYLGFNSEFTLMVNTFACMISYITKLKVKEWGVSEMNKR